MANGDGDQKVWDTIRAVERDINNLARDGCGHKRWHEAVSAEIRIDLAKERSDRERMGEFILREMKEMKDSVLKDNKTMRNQILVGMFLLMSLTLVIGKILK